MLLLEKLTVLEIINMGHNQELVKFRENSDKSESVSITFAWMMEVFKNSVSVGAIFRKCEII